MLGLYHGFINMMNNASQFRLNDLVEDLLGATSTERYPSPYVFSSMTACPPTWESLVAAQCVVPWQVSGPGNTA